MVTNFIFILAGIGVVTLIDSIFFIMKDYAFSLKSNKSARIYLIPNWFLFIAAIGWFAVAILLYMNLQAQLVS